MSLPSYSGKSSKVRGFLRFIFSLRSLKFSSLIFFNLSLSSSIVFNSSLKLIIIKPFGLCRRVLHNKNISNALF